MKQSKKNMYETIKKKTSMKQSQKNDRKHKKTKKKKLQKKYNRINYKKKTHIISTQKKHIN